MTFTVSVAAADRALATKADVEAVLGAGAMDSVPSPDALLLQISDLISRECGIAAVGATPPTLRQETLVETIRMRRGEFQLRLARRFVGTVSSITEDGAALVAADYELDAGAGTLQRLDADGNVKDWPQAVVVITYTAGFSTAPTDLKLAVVRIVQEQMSASARDPLVRSETVEGIGRTDFWVNAASGGAASSAPGAISSVASAMLDPYRNMLV